MTQLSDTKTVLVVEDDVHLLSSIERRLSRCGFHVLAATNGEEAIELARTSSPDAITLDVRLPDLDGLEVAEALQAEPATSDIPIVFLTGKVDAHVKDSCAQIKFGYFIRKPFDPVLLVRLLQSILEHDRPPEDQTGSGFNRCSTSVAHACG